MDRLLLHEKFKELTDNVYFQPPENVTMAFPCIVYQRDRGAANFAGNTVYRYTQRYQVTVIDANPDSEIVKALTTFPQSTFLRHFARPGLNHDVFAIYF
jgi:hypothetical protein